jgi:hypothetical protein
LTATTSGEEFVNMIYLRSTESCSGIWLKSVEKKTLKEADLTNVLKTGFSFEETTPILRYKNKSDNDPQESNHH